MKGVNIVILCIFFSFFLLTIGPVFAGINITDADAVYETNLYSVSIPTTPQPITTILIVNDDASSDISLSPVSIPTKPLPIDEIFIVNDDTASEISLSAVSIPTQPLPLKEIFILNGDTNVYNELTYSKGLMNDITPPIITNITITNITGNSVTIKWNTDEVADSLVKYGEAPGVYTYSKSASLYVKNHTITLTGLSSYTIYYFIVNSTDRSGNSAESSEYSFTTSGGVNQPPVASFTYSPGKPVVYQTITFNASDSYDPDGGSITNYEWDFGDGNTTTITEPIITHSYASAGTYNVNLTITDDEGARNSTNKTITIYQTTAIFDTGAPLDPYPSISGTHNGTITPFSNITVNKLYTYPCPGTGGHTEYARIWNKTWSATATWKGYVGDWSNITFDKTVALIAYETYNYTIITGSYPQIHHTPSLKTENGLINCTEFIDANGKVHKDWILAIKLY